ncbi:hypothetical protein [Sphingobacterium psychroaquaticum]|uniref:Uncharacterized protein n=1 Tax=Sphingobacterium psychroaquaticum TaxID=561061 RepID=A0A1X7K656_9SPHI|nr:hypothetical protein [Sphingobacterium psychroaquaticum]SMG35815.1 hypothetical protein SAMN05660862_2553 [Sphingobacterium psychroaquaticum]
MDKSSKKRNSYNTSVIDQLQKKYGFSKAYIRQCLDGTRQATVADKLKKDYKNGVQKLNAVLAKV